MISFDCRLKRQDFTLDLAFEAGPGVTALFGPSGAGKSTVIDLIAGLARPERGRILVDGATLLDSARHIDVPAHKRRIGLVFQDAQLFPHMSVQKNLLYGRRFATTASIDIDAVVKVLDLGALLARYPATLSGGERQRVALGRALLADPRLLLMDEPLAALDAARKRDILPFLERLTETFAIPVLYVSHAIDEVMRLADQVVRIERGRVIATGTPEAVLSPLAERFETFSRLSAAAARYLPDYDITMLRHPAGDIAVPGQVVQTGALRVVIPATQVALAKGAPGRLSLRTALRGRVERIDADSRPTALVTLELEGGEHLLASLTRLAIADLDLKPGDAVTALVKAAAVDGRAPLPRD